MVCFAPQVSTVQCMSLPITPPHTQVHRRLLHTSHDSVEPLNETGLNGDGLIIRGSHLLFFDTIDKSTVAHRVAGTALMLRPEYLFIEDEGSPGDFMNKYYTNVSQGV